MLKRLPSVWLITFFATAARALLMLIISTALADKKCEKLKKRRRRKKPAGCSSRPGPPGAGPKTDRQFQVVSATTMLPASSSLGQLVRALASSCSAGSTRRLATLAYEEFVAYPGKAGAAPRVLSRAYPQQQQQGGEASVSVLACRQVRGTVCPPSHPILIAHAASQPARVHGQNSHPGHVQMASRTASLDLTSG